MMKLNLFVTAAVFTAAAAAVFVEAAANHNHLRRGGNNDDRQLMPSFPPYNQQCRDDAGPIFVDDVETFGQNGRYHDGKPAFAVGTSCPDPLKGACASGKSQTAAFLEGPVDCGGNGWFCRIVEQPGWPVNNLVTDLNFAHCNTTEARNGDMTDTDGHCHGSDADDTYYWWVRDHWFRGYNGRMRCCCGWNSQILPGRLVNNCDYRRLVTPTENLDNCRDANEENVQPFREGCNAQNLPPLNVPLVEQNPEQCWEVQNFGEPCDDNCVTTGTGPITDNDEEEDSGGSGDNEGDDESNNNNNEEEDDEDNTPNNEENDEEDDEGVGNNNNEEEEDEMEENEEMEEEEDMDEEEEDEDNISRRSEEQPENENEEEEEEYNGPQPPFPSYNQNCEDDAGPRWKDDLSTFNGGRYHDGSAAIAVGDDTCPDALAGACATKPKKAAFIEGPINCNGQGWFCRILEEPGWNPRSLIGDLNFGYCNTTEGFEDPGYDRSGHCHGSDSDDTYYWWVRDHWFRQYNGRVRCCCGWTGMQEGRIVNRCDHRRLLLPTEDVNECRDANEENVSPYNGGCTSNGAPTIGQPLEEDDSKCWEIQRFGDTGETVIDNNNNSEVPTGDPIEPPPLSTPEPTSAPTNVPTQQPTAANVENENACVDPTDKFNFLHKKKAKILSNKKCSWVAKKWNKRCKLKLADDATTKAKNLCPLACGVCVPDDLVCAGFDRKKCKKNAGCKYNKTDMTCVNKN